METAGIWLWLMSSFVAALLSLGLVIHIYRRIPPVSIERKKPFVQATACYFAAAVSVLLLFWWFKAAVLESGMAFHRSLVFTLGAAGLGVLFVSVLWMKALFVWVHRLLAEVEIIGLRGWKRIGALSAGILAALPLSQGLGLDLPVYVFSLVLLCFLGLFDLFIERRSLNLTWIAVWMALMSAGAAYGLSAYSRLEPPGRKYLPGDVSAVEELGALSRRIAGDDTLVTLLSTPVPFTVKEEALRREIAPHWERLPHLSEHFSISDILLVNPVLKQSVIEGGAFQPADYWLALRETSGSSLFYKADSLDAGFALLLPDTGLFAGNALLLTVRPLPAPGALHSANGFGLIQPASLFSGLFLLFIGAVLLWALPLSAFKRFSFHETFPFFDKPSLRNRIQLWLAGFTLGAFVLIGLISIDFFRRYGLVDTDRVYEYLSALLNLYVFLLLAALAVAVAAGNSITRPLSVIGNKLQALRLGHNEPLEWAGQDELGQLVDAYNHMIAEVEKSAEKLRLSEREGAWREMAKQVAHEIKNPLTPMKLSIQHLQRAYQADPAQAAPLVRRVSETLIEQIDTLARIAGEFAHFAQMPAPQNEVFDFRETAKAVFQLFQAGQHPQDLHLSLHLPPEAVFVHADRTQLTRVLNNIVKNAVQAIPDGKPGKVEIELRHGAVLSVRDNGSGIPDNARSRVFYPSFTTKSSGMGLGLAMCKNILDAAGGRIWFETVVGKGTVFFVELTEYIPGNPDL